MSSNEEPRPAQSTRPVSGRFRGEARGEEGCFSSASRSSRIHTHFKGFASYETGYATLSLEPFISRFARTPGSTSISCPIMKSRCASPPPWRRCRAMTCRDLFLMLRRHSFLLHPDTLAGESCANRFAADLRLRARRRRLRHDRRLDGVRRVSRQGALRLYAARRPAAREDLSPRRPHGDARGRLPGSLVRSPAPRRDRLRLARLPRLQQGRAARRADASPVQGDAAIRCWWSTRSAKGRVACFTSDILPHWGSPRFTSWPSYVPFWERVFRWLTKMDG